MVCIPACATGGVVAGLAVAGVGASPKRHRFLIAASSVALLTGAMGCACVGHAGVAGLALGFGAGRCLGSSGRCSNWTSINARLRTDSCLVTSGRAHRAAESVERAMNRVPMRSARARIVALLAALVVVLPGGASLGAQYFCRMMDRAVPACCCAPSENDEARGETGVRPADCCSRLAAPERSAAAARVPSRRPVAALSAILPEPTYLAPSVSMSCSTTAQARAPPTVKSPLFIAYCAFLS
jgi:hypothetical protein